MYFMGRDVEYWKRAETLYEDIQPIVDTPAGKRLLRLGRIQALQRSIDAQRIELERLQNELE